MSILVTGGIGHIGSNVARLLIEQGREVVLHDRVGPTEGNVLAKLMDRTKLEIGNVADLAHVLQVVKKYKVKGIIHCASMIGQAATDHPIEALQVNIIGSTNMLEAARLLDLGRVVVLSSSGAMGGPADLVTPIREDQISLPSSGIYNNCKLVCEQIVYTYRQIYKVDTIAFRPRNVYGPGERRAAHAAPIYELMNAALAGQPVVQSTGADSCFDLTYVKDLARGIIQGYDCKSPSYHVYHLSYGKLRNVSDICKVMREVFPKLKIEVGPGLWGGVLAGGLQVDTKYRSMQRPPQDITRARKDFGFEPAYDIDSGIPAWLKWIKEGIY